MAQQQPSPQDLLFVSFYGKVFALHRLTGAQVWRWSAPKGSGGPVMLLPDGDCLFACCNGYTWALDPATGAERWYQPFEGEGTGIPMLATMRSTSGQAASAASTAAAQHAAAAAAVAVLATTAAIAS